MGVMKFWHRNESLIIDVFAATKRAQITVIFTNVARVVCVCVCVCVCAHSTCHLPFKFFMCCTAILRMVILSGFLPLLDETGRLKTSSLRCLFIFWRRLFSISLCVDLCLFICLRFVLWFYFVFVYFNFCFLFLKGNYFRSLLWVDWALDETLDISFQSLSMSLEPIGKLLVSMLDVAVSTISLSWAGVFVRRVLVLVAVDFCSSCGLDSICSTNNSIGGCCCCCFDVLQCVCDYRSCISPRARTHMHGSDTSSTSVFFRRRFLFLFLLLFGICWLLSV